MHFYEYLGKSDFCVLNPDINMEAWVFYHHSRI